MKTNKQIIIEKIKSEGYILGCYDKQLDKLNKTNLKKVIDNIRYNADTKVFLNRKCYIVQIDEVDNMEIDFNMITIQEYENMYGEWEDYL